MVWLDDFLQQYSLAYQELGKKFDKAVSLLSVYYHVENAPKPVQYTE